MQNDDEFRIVIKTSEERYADVEAAIVLPGGADGPAYAVYNNYHVILRWNRSDFFATSVGLLAEVPVVASVLSPVRRNPPSVSWK